jgi:hypothetical protein
VVLGLSRVVDLLEVQLRPLLHDAVAHADVGLHRAVGIFLLDEVDADHPRPPVGAGFVEHAEVDIFGQRLEAEEDEGRTEGRVVLDDLIVDLVEGLHELALVVPLHKVALVVVFGELAEERPKLNAVVAIADVLEQHVAHVLLEDVQREHQDEEVGDLHFEQHPEVVLVARYHLQLLLRQHRQVRHQLHQLPLVGQLFRQLAETNPALLLCLLRRTDLERLAVSCQVDVGVSDDVLAVLDRGLLTKSSSSLQSKWSWCSTPLGMSLRNSYN